MAHHKRKRPKNRRGGCLLCKLHKANGCEHDKHSVEKRTAAARSSLVDALDEIDSGASMFRYRFRMPYSE